MKWLDTFEARDAGYYKPHLCYLGSQPSGTTTTTQKNEPWAGQQEPLLDIYAQARNLDQNAVPQYYPGSTYQGLTGQQQGIMSQLIGYGQGGGNTALNAANRNISGVLSPNYTNQTEAAFDMTNPKLGQIGSGSVLNDTQPAFGTSQNTLNSLAGGSVTGLTNPAFSKSQGYLSDVLGGKYLDPFSSPGFQSVVDKTLASVIPQVSSSFIGGGRADSGLAQAAETSAATNAVGNIANQAYQSERTNQQNAASQAETNQALGLNTTLGATGQAASNYGTGLTATLGAGGLLSNNFLTQQGNQIKGAATAPLIDQSQLGDLGTALNTSGATQTDLQNQINSAMARYNYGQMLPWNQLGMYEGAVTGTGSPGGTSTTSQPYYSNPLANVLGAGAAGAGLLGATGAFGAAGWMAPLLAAI